MKMYKIEKKIKQEYKSITEFSRHHNITQQNLYNWLRKDPKKLPYSRLEFFAEKLNCSVNDFIG